MAMVDYTSGTNIVLLKYAGSYWTPANINRVGTNPASVGLVIDGNNRAYVAFDDNVASGAYVVSVDPFDYNAEWDAVGSGPAFKYSGYIVSLRLKALFTQIYLLINHADIGVSNVHLLSSTGGGFTSIYSVPGYMSDIAVSSVGAPYVAFVNPKSPNDQVTVMGRFNSSWVRVGAVLQSAGSVYRPCLVVTSDGVPYVGFRDEAAGGMFAVIRTSFDPNQ